MKRSAPLPTRLGLTDLLGHARNLHELYVEADVVTVLEQRHTDGRSTLVRNGEDLLPPSTSVGSSVHGYGGGAVALAPGQIVYVDSADQQIYRLNRTGGPRRLTPGDDRRYAGMVFDHRRTRFVSICEDHRSDREPTNSLVAVPAEGGAVEVLVQDSDFVSNPSIAPSGDQLAWCSWDHPWMPWDNARVVIARILRDGRIGRPRIVAGGDGTSAGHPVWAEDGTLYYVHDLDGWWSLFSRTSDGKTRRVLAGGEIDVPGRLASTFDIRGDWIAAAPSEGLRQRLTLVRRSTGEVRELAREFSSITSPRLLSDGRVAFLGASATSPLSAWLTGIDRPLQLVRRWGAPGTRLEGLAEPEIVRASTGGVVIEGAFYRPTGRLTPSQDPPPLLVSVHGGPVAPATLGVRFGMYAAAIPAFWTTRGFAVLEVNYRGTLGYGRGFREALYGSWGCVEVSDIRFLVERLIGRGQVDRNRVVIRGGSAGGWTVLRALTQSPLFAAGTAYFPVSDLESFRLETHKYESRYLERLVGPYSQERYAALSPTNLVGRMRSPLLLIHGAEDTICRPSQSERIVRALNKRARDVEYLRMPAEGHGFVRTQSISLALTTEERFYRRVLSF